MEWYDNMKKKNYLLTLLILFIAFTMKVDASTCSNERIIELSSLASNVQVSYEPYEDNENLGISDTHNVPYSQKPAFYVTIYNLDEGLNAVVTREDIKKAVVVTPDDADDDGVILIDAGTAFSIKNFNIKIRSDDDNCQNEVLKTATVTTPKYNAWFEREACEENPDFEMCQEFTYTDYSNVSDSEFSEKLTTYKEEKKKEEERKNSLWYKISSFLNKYKWIFIAVALAVIAIVIVVIIRRKKSRLI